MARCDKRRVSHLQVPLCRSGWELRGSGVIALSAPARACYRLSGTVESVTACRRVRARMHPDRAPLHLSPTHAGGGAAAVASSPSAWYCFHDFSAGPVWLGLDGYPKPQRLQQTRARLIRSCTGAVYPVPARRLLLAHASVLLATPQATSELPADVTTTPPAVPRTLAAAWGELDIVISTSDTLHGIGSRRALSAGVGQRPPQARTAGSIERLGNVSGRHFDRRQPSLAGALQNVFGH